MTLVIAAIVGILAFFATRMYDRVALENARYDNGRLESDNKVLLEKCVQLEEDLHAAKRVPMDHADVGQRLLDLAKGASKGVV